MILAFKVTGISANSTRIGERLQAQDGSTPKVLSLTLRAEAESVYNIEVDGDHCYRVGRQGLLVHNTSERPPCEEKGLARGQSLPDITEYYVRYAPRRSDPLETPGIYK